MPRQWWVPQSVQLGGAAGDGVCGTMAVGTSGELTPRREVQAAWISVRVYWGWTCARLWAARCPLWVRVCLPACDGDATVPEAKRCSPPPAQLPTSPASRC